jgi:cytidylate kinase
MRENVANEDGTKLERGIVIAIDGLAASGKATISKGLARHFGFAYLDTGLLYRLVGFHVKDRHIDVKNVAKVLATIDEIDFTNSPGEMLYSEEVGRMASIIGTIPEVRSSLYDIQRNFPKGKPGAILDGRDIGTVIFPDADCKLFIEADIEIRSQRRYKQLQIKNQSVIYDTVLAQLRARDERDINRAVAPLKAAEDAIIIDTTLLDLESSIDFAIKVVKNSLAGTYSRFKEAM